MRPGEAADLEWRDIDYRTESIKLPAIKTKCKRDRWIPINRVMAKLLNWCNRHAEQEPRRGTRLPRHLRSLTHVFLTSCGCPWKLRNWVKAFKAARDKVGLSDEIVLHGARHSFATRALMAGVDVATLAELLGHKDIATTQRYLHLTGKARFLHGAMDLAISGKTPRTNHMQRLTMKGVTT